MEMPNDQSIWEWIYAGITGLIAWFVHQNSKRLDNVEKSSDTKSATTKAELNARIDEIKDDLKDVREGSHAHHIAAAEKYVPRAELDLKLSSMNNKLDQLVQGLLLNKRSTDNS